MPAELHLPAGWLISFLLVLTRLSGIFIFLPLPGAQGTAETAKALFALASTIALFPLWPPPPEADPSIGLLIGWVLLEAAFGLAVGLLVAFLTEIFQLGAQMLSLQAGLSFASTFNPNTNADSTVLITFAQLMAGVLFFVAGLDRMLLHAFGRSLTVFPPGSFPLSAELAGQILPAGSAIFSSGLLTVLPVIAFLIMVDLALALLGRLNAQLQLISLALPLKLLSTIVLLAWLTVLMPRLFSRASGVLTAQVEALLHR